MTKWTLPEGREPITDDELVALTRRLVGSSIDYKERYEVAVRDAKEAEAYAAELEATLARGTIVEYDDGSRVSLSAFAGGASEGGAWSHLTLMKEEHDGAVSFRHYTADGGWCSPRVHSTLAELKGQNDE